MSNITADELYKYQEDNGYFSTNPKSKKTPFTIVIPPPNITGQLHLGHAFTMTMQDITTRYKRMMGYDCLLLPGTDHAAIATQMIVEKQLLSKGIERKKIGRAAFLKEVWKWKETCTENITKQLRKLEYSADWNHERFTMDDGMSKAVNHAFVKLYNDGLIYKDKRLVNWDPVLLTSVSDLEVNMIEEDGFMWHINYQIDGTKDFITIATTRPETMLGDTGIAVNPKDNRFNKYIGKSAIIPIIGRKILIVGDDYADMTKGTGAVKITPAHDFNDFEVGKRHNLPIINILNETANIITNEIPETENNNFIKSLNGIDRFTARKMIVEKLTELGALIKTEVYKHQVPHSERGGAIIEPRLTEQWYLNVSDMAKKSIELVETGKIKFVPDMWKNTFFSWLKNIQPWCISRQLWWGHQIPAFYTDDGKIIVAETKEDAQKITGNEINLTQDNDSLDTWFSSGLWPMSTLGWPNDTMDYKRYFPTSTLITGFDIIFFWVARMIMFSVYFTGKAPFDTVVLHGLVRDEKGQKMSKTKGNVINPLELVDEYGIDAVRWTICSLSGQGRDINFGKSLVENGKRFITKLNNAIKFWLDQDLKNYINTNKGKEKKSELPAICSYILDKMNTAIDNAKQAIENYRYDEYAHTLYHFIWDEFCDNFIELSKSELKTENKNKILSTANIVIQNILKMLQIVIPYISAKLWENIGYGNIADLINEKYAEKIEIENKDDINLIKWMIEITSTIRNIRAENKISFKTPLNINFTKIPNKYKSSIEKITSFNNLQSSLKTDSMISKTILSDTVIMIDLPKLNISGNNDKLKDRISELEKRIISLKNQIEKMNDKAPENIINDRKESLKKAETELNNIRTSI